MTPVLNQILFKPFPSEEVSKGGILVAEAFREVSNKGTIVSVGNGTAKRPMKLKVGIVGYRVKDWGTEIMVDNELHFLMDDKSIIAIEE
jgi:co-chaperonin GroES (HSP10)